MSENKPSSQQDTLKDPQANGVSASRRSLLLATASAPLVATLHSGAAMAASSAFQCIGGDFSNKKFLENGNSINGDTAVRVEVAYFKRRSGTKNDPRYKACKDLPNDLYLIEGTLYHNSGRSYVFDVNKLRDPNKSPYDETSAFVLILVDADSGLELGPWPKYQLVEDGGAGTGITQSCWNSLTNSQYSSL